MSKVARLDVAAGKVREGVSKLCCNSEEALWEEEVQTFEEEVAVGSWVEFDKEGFARFEAAEIEPGYSGTGLAERMEGAGFVHRGNAWAAPGSCWCRRVSGKPVVRELSGLMSGDQPYLNSSSGDVDGRDFFEKRAEAALGCLGEGLVLS